MAITGSTDLENRYWIPLMEQGINVIYKLAESPDSICGDLIKKLTQETCQMEKPGENGEKQKDEEIEEKENGEEEGEKEKAGDEQMEEGPGSQGKIVFV